MKKLCECGCGLPTSIAKRTDKRFGHVRPGHVSKVHNGQAKPLADRFAAKVNTHGKMPSVVAVSHYPEIANTECWEWFGATVNGRYGNMLVNGKTELAHRVAWFLKTGKWPTRFVLHKCDNPRCVRTLHLFEGSARDNYVDMINKDRAPGR